MSYHNAKLWAVDMKRQGSWLRQAEKKANHLDLLFYTNKYSLLYEFCAQYMVI